METRRWLAGLGALGVGSLVIAGGLVALPLTSVARQEASPAVRGQLLEPAIELAAALATAREGQDGAEVRSVELDDWDGELVYGMVLDNGAELYVDAATGEVREALDAGSATPLEPAVSLVEAQEAAIEGQSDAAVTWVGLADWGGTLTYEVVLDNGVQVEVDASTGDILATE